MLLLNVLKCTVTKNSPTPNVNNAKIKNPCSRAVVLKVYGPPATNNSITWKLVRNQNLRLQPRPTELQTLDMGPSNQCFNESSNNANQYQSIRTT